MWCRPMRLSRQHCHEAWTDWWFLFNMVDTRGMVDAQVYFSVEFQTFSNLFVPRRFVP